MRRQEHMLRLGRKLLTPGPDDRASDLRIHFCFNTRNRFRFRFFLVPPMILPGGGKRSVSYDREPALPPCLVSSMPAYWRTAMHALRVREVVSMPHAGAYKKSQRPPFSKAPGPVHGRHDGRHGLQCLALGQRQAMHHLFTEQPLGGRVGTDCRFVMSI